jgi:hypothetical protein
MDNLHAEGIAELVQRIDSVDGRSFIPKASASIGPAIYFVLASVATICEIQGKDLPASMFP